MGPYRNFISFRYDGSFFIRIRDNAVSERVNRCGITVITFTGDHDAEYTLSEYRKRDAVEKLFMSSKTFTGGEPVRVHGMDALRREMFVNLILIAIRSRIYEYMRSSILPKKYSVEKMLLELHRLRKVILQDMKFLYGPMMSSQTSPGFSHLLTVREESLSILSFRDE